MTDITDRECFGLPAAWAILAESAKKHDREAFHHAADMLSEESITIIRGMTQAMFHLSRISEEDACYQFAQKALLAVTEVIALCATQIEHQIESDGYKKHGWGDEP